MVESPVSQDVFDLAMERAGSDAGRRAALATFRRMGFPTTKQEEWRFTSVREIAETAFVPGEQFAVGQDEWDVLGGKRLVFVNGHFEGDSLGSLPSGVVAGALSSLSPEMLGTIADENHSAFAALNRATYTDGAYVFVPKGTVVDEPIVVLHVFGSDGEPSMSNVRNLYVLEENAQATIIEVYVAKNRAWINSVGEAVVGDNAILNHVKVQLGNDRALHTTVQKWKLGRACKAKTTVVTFDGKLVRNDTESYLGGEGCEATINGLYVGRGDSHIDNHTLLHHAAPNCPSHELFKGVLNDKSGAVFSGRIFVDQVAQKTDSKQSNMNLLLTDDATINTKPQLEIFADDVRCTHGATIGRLDADAMFYLRSRGIPETDARNLLIYAFASDVIERIGVPQLVEPLEKILFERFAEQK